MSTAETSFACAWALVDELVRGGVRHACLSPGSRSTPLALALDRHPGVRVHVHLDERSSAFFALGLSKALREPVAVTCTSGTAAAEFFPAVVEASQSRVPLIVLTADRPPRFRGTGANQTIDQVKLYGKYVRAYLEVPVPATGNDREAWASAGRDAVRASGEVNENLGERTAMGGPVHLNCPVDEPLTPTATDVPQSLTKVATRSGVPRTGGDDPISLIMGSVDLSACVMIAGPSSDISDAMADFAAILQTPLLADPSSGGRRPAGDLAIGLGGKPSEMTAGVPLLESEEWLREHPPDSVVLMGGSPTSRAAQRLIERVHRIVVVDDGHLDPAPGRDDAVRIRLPPSFVADQGSAGDLEGVGPEIPWLAAWRAADAAARITIDQLLDSWDEPSEMRVARDLAAAIPHGGRLFVGNSMPVRDLDAFMAPRTGLRLLANRGASGIDGLLSPAPGVAPAKGPTYALLGDLSFLYDAGALLWNATRGIDLVVVVNDNGGGQIFAGLGQAALPSNELERLFVTPHLADLERLCGAAGAGHTRVERSADLLPALEAAVIAGGIQVVRVLIDAERDRARRAELREAVDAAIAGIDPHAST